MDGPCLRVSGQFSRWLRADDERARHCEGVDIRITGADGGPTRGG